MTAGHDLEFAQVHLELCVRFQQKVYIFSETLPLCACFLLKYRGCGFVLKRLQPCRKKNLFALTNSDSWNLLRMHFCTDRSGTPCSSEPKIKNVNEQNKIPVCV